MNIKIKRIFSLLIVFLMTFNILNTNILKNSKILAKQETTVQCESSNVKENKVDADKPAEETQKAEVKEVDADKPAEGNEKTAVKDTDTDKSVEKIQKAEVKEVDADKSAEETQKAEVKEVDSDKPAEEIQKDEVKEVSAEKSVEQTVKVKIRVEANDRTIVPSTELTVSNFDLTPYGGKKHDEVRLLNAIIKALESKNIDCDDQSKFLVNPCIQNIDGVKKNSVNEYDGWRCYVNNAKFSFGGPESCKIKDGDSVAIVFVENTEDYIYSSFDKEEVKVAAKEDFKLNLTGINGKKETVLVSDAKILINNKEMTVDGKAIATDKDGNITLKLDTPGIYTISAERSNNKNRDITRPYCKLIVGEAQEETPKDEKVKIKIEKNFDGKLTAGNSYNLSAKLFDDKDVEIEGKKFKWKSYDTDIVQIDENTGLVKALSEGTVTISVCLDDNENVKEKIYLEVVEPESDFNASNAQTVKQFIEVVENYYNTTYFKENLGQLDYNEYSAMARANADLKKKKWYVVEKYMENYDRDLHLLASKAHQSTILMNINKDPNNYDGRHLIDEIAETLDNTNDYFGFRELEAVIAIDQYNEKYPDKKVAYNTKQSVEKIIEAQCKDGGFKQSEFEKGKENSCVPNTGVALIALNKHREVEGANEAINKAVQYLHNVQKDDGGLYNYVFITGYHSEAVRGLLAVGEDLKSKEWTSLSGKNPIDALFNLKKSNGAFDNMKGESKNNRGWIEATWKGLYALAELKDAGYGDYKINLTLGENSNVPEKPVEEKTCKVNMAIVLPKGGGGYDLIFEPQEVEINTKKHDGGINPFGALQAATTLYQATGDFISSIYGCENKGMNGWVYTVNGVMSDTTASNVELKEGDKVIWYYTTNGMEGKVPTWEDITNETPTNNKVNSLEITNKTQETEFKKGSDAKISIQVKNNSTESKNASLVIGLFDEQGKLVNYSAVEQKIRPQESVDFMSIMRLPKEGNYKIKGFVWDSMEYMNVLSDIIQLPIK